MAVQHNVSVQIYKIHEIKQTKKLTLKLYFFFKQFVKPRTSLHLFWLSSGIYWTSTIPT